MPSGAPCRESCPQGRSWVGHQRALNWACACKLLSVPARCPLRPTYSCFGLQPELLHGVVLQMLLSEMPLHHCVAALDTGFFLTYLLSGICPGFMEAVMGLSPPSTGSDTVMGMHGNARRSCWSVCPAFCPSWGGKVPCVVSTHPGSSSRRLLCKWDTNPTHVSQWDLVPSLPWHGTGEGSCSRATSGASCSANTQTLQLTLCLCSARYHFVGEPGLQTFSYFYLPAISSGWGAGTCGLLLAMILLLHHSSPVCHGELSALPGNAHC